MKELSIEEKAKRYDEALKEASAAYKDEDRHLKATLERIFPELKESDAEMVRKGLIAIITDFDSLYLQENYFLSREETLAWLEKQGEHAKFRDSIQVGDKVTKNQDGVLVNLSQFKRVAKKDKKQSEQKPADKVEPKFHEGDWLCENEPNNYARFIQILETVNVQGKERYRISRDIHNDEDIVEFGFVEKYYHKFDIQDAKDGDVLYAKGNYFKEYLFMFSSVTEDNVISTHFGYDVFHRTFDKKLTRFGREEDFVSVIPATKEQRDLLFKNMTDAGYTFDFEKKELKKIEQKPADKIEQKFKAGDWVVCGQYGAPCQIESIKDGRYYFTSGIGIPVESVNIDYHLWTIQDAKDGDVLHSPSHRFIWIYKDNEHYHACVNMNYVTENVSTNGLISITNDACPATKDEQTILFARMKESNYKWDAEKKELKMIEQKSAWSEEDENHVKSILSTIECCKAQFPNAQAVVEAYNADIDWLKSLRPQKRSNVERSGKNWKPTEEHLSALKEAFNKGSITFHDMEVLAGLYQILIAL